MDKRFALVGIRLMVSVNLLYAAIFAKFAGTPQSVALFTQMSQAVHGLISQPVFRLGSGVFETTVAVLFLIPKTGEGVLALQSTGGSSHSYGLRGLGCAERRGNDRQLRR